MDLYLSLGSNLGNKAENIRQAINLLQEKVGDVIKVSSFIVNKPVGFSSENDFVNAAAHLQTNLSVAEILKATQKIEKQLGRKEKSKNGCYKDRIIDIDLLLYGDYIGIGNGIIVPHPRMSERLFVLEPLAEIAPNIVVPGFETDVKTLLNFCKNAHIELVNEHCDLPKIVKGIRRLLPQLTSHYNDDFEAEFKRSFLSSESNNLLFALFTREEEMVGMATLCICTSPVGKKGWIEDVVISEKHRGKGWGKMLIVRLIAEGKQRGINSLNLTSRPERINANKLYQRLGFQMRETNVYKMPFNN